MQIDDFSYLLNRHVVNNYHKTHSEFLIFTDDYMLNWPRDDA